MSCNCRKLQRRILEADLENLSDTLKKQASDCPSCSVALERALTTHNLIALKKYERPEPFSARRCSNRVRFQLEEELATPHQPSVFEFITQALSSTSFRYGLAAALLGLVAIQVATWQKLPALSPTAEPNTTHGSMQLLASTNPIPSVPAQPTTTPLQLASNLSPGSIHYGNTPTVPVGFGE